MTIVSTAMDVRTIFVPKILKKSRFSVQTDVRANSKKKIQISISKGDDMIPRAKIEKQLPLIILEELIFTNICCSLN